MLLTDMIDERELRFLMKCCLRSLDNNWHLAEDAVQETLLSVLRKGAEFEHRAQGFAFLKSAARFACLSVCRSPGRQLLQDLRTTARPECVTETPAQIVEQADTVLAIERLIDRELDPVTAGCVRRHAAGVTFVSIADELGVTHQAVQQRFHRGVAKTRRVATTKLT